MVNFGPQTKKFLQCILTHTNITSTLIFLIYFKLSPKIHDFVH